MGTLYCEEHERYYRADTGCMICRMAKGENHVIEEVKRAEVKEEIKPRLGKCPYCEKEALFWNAAVNMYECSNDGCRRRISRFTMTGLGKLSDDPGLLKDVPAVLNDKNDDARTVIRNFTASPKKFQMVFNEDEEYDGFKEKAYRGDANVQDGARTVIRNYAVSPKKFRQKIDEDDEYDGDMYSPYDVEYGRRNKKISRGGNPQTAAIKSFLIILAFICLGLAVWTGYLLYKVEIGELEGIILLAVVGGLLIWNVFGIMEYKSVNLPFIGLLLVTILAGLAISAFAGVEPFSSIKEDMIQFSGIHLV